MLLKNKDLFFFLIIIFLVIFASVARAQDICDIGNIKKVLRKVLYFYFINPQDSPLSLNELKDLLVFYLGIKEQVGQVDCSVTGSISNSSISSIIDSGWNVTDTIPTCADGTKYGECSTFKPKYCYTGSLLHRCDYCGCPSPSQCSTSGKCGNATCSSDLDCGESGFVRFNHCLDGKLYRNYDNITCLNSQCSNETVTVLIDDCKSKGEGCEWNQTIINYVCQGKMTNETCVDYDGGDNLLMASYAKKGTQMQYDKCGTAGQNYEIIEGVCQNNELRGVPHSCPTGTECRNIRFEPAVNAYVSACVNATSGNFTSQNSMHSNRIYNMSIMNYNYPNANAYLYIVKGMEKNYAYGSRQSQLSLSNGALYIFNHAYEFANNYSRDWYYDKYGIESEPDHLSIIISDLPVDQSMNKILDVMITIDGGVKKIVYFP